MPSLVGVRDTNGRGQVNGMAANGVFDQYRDDFARDDMRQDEDDRYRRAVRNGGPSFDRFNTDYLDQSSLSDFRGNEPRFELDHLATFSAGARNGVIHAEDGLRKLRQMENTTGIWSMRCLLIVERNHLVIVDNSTAEELEKFPIHLVQDPTAIFKNDHREIYNNLVLFTIVDDPKKRSPQADMHIFQSSRVPAQEIVDEILAAKSGQQRLLQGDQPRIVPPAGALASDASSKAYNFQEMREMIDSRQYQINNSATELQQFNQTGYNQAAYNQHNQFSGPLVQRQSLITRVSPLRERESIVGGSTEVLEKDVQLLNHCFDDIEKFVARLQQAAESYKELEKRKRDRGAKNKKKQSGDGMLNARARPPPDRDFVDIFQKFKLSFNLLAKLKAHIHDPNAPELVHFLFTPLSLIYEASRDPYHGNQNLGDQALAPVVTGDAKQLLLNCLTSKEIELWQALGKNWTTSRDEWQGPIPPYVPEFYDGWQPTAGLDDLPSRSAIMAQPNIIAAPLPMIEPVRTPAVINARDRGHVMQQRPIPFPDDDRPVVDIFHRQDDFNRAYRPNSREFDSRGFEPVNMPSAPRSFESPGGLNYESSRFEAQSHERSPPRLDVDSRLSSDFSQPYSRVVRQEAPKNTERDYLPSGIPSRQDDNAAYLDELKRMEDSIIYEAAHDRMGKNAKELSVQKGDILQVLDNSKNWWKLRNYKGEIGFAPYTILKAVKAEGDNNFYQPHQVTGRYPPASSAGAPYFGDERGHAQRDPSLDRNPENIQHRQEFESLSATPAKERSTVANQNAESTRSGSPKNKEHESYKIETLQLQVKSTSGLPDKRTPSPIQQLDSILLSNTSPLTPENPANPHNNGISVTQRQNSIILQPTSSILQLNRRALPVQNKGVSIMTQTQMVMPKKQEPKRGHSPSRQRRDSHSPRHWFYRVPSKRQNSPALQKRDSPTPDRRVSVTTQTQTSPTLYRRESDRGRSQAPLRRDSDRQRSPIPHRRSPPILQRWGSRVTSTNHYVPVPQKRASPTSGRRISSVLQRRRSSSPRYDRDPANYQRRGPSMPSYVNVPVTKKNNLSQKADVNTPPPRRNQASFKRDPNPTSFTKSAPEHVPVAPALPSRPTKDRLYENQSANNRKKQSGNNKNKLHEELLDRMRRPRSFKSQREERVKKKREVLFIDQYSTAEEVGEWLRNKGFSDLAQETYEDYSGSDMFQLTLAQIEEDLGHEEAFRLDGQLTLQKNASGYTPSSMQELNEILRQRKQDCEPGDNED